MNTKELKVAIVCDWLTTMGGAEQVVLELHRMFPDAPIYTSSYAAKKMPLFKDADVRTGFIQKLPFSSKHQLWPVLRRFYFSHLSLDKYNLIISSSGAEAKAVNMSLEDRIRETGDGERTSTRDFQLPAPRSQLPTPGRRPVHINYCHSPTQYYWVRPEEYMSASTAGGVGFLNPVWRLGLKLLKPWMKRWDYLAAQNPDYIIANSNAVRERINKFYDRDSEVLYPPADIERFKPEKKTSDRKRSGFLIAGRQVHHKRFDLAVKACSESGIELRVTGDGPEHERLKAVAGPTIKFLGRVSDEELVKEFQSAEGYIFPQEDDFGIVAVESLAAGTPVIAYRAGGALDIVSEGENGIFFDEQSVESLRKAIKQFTEKSWNHEAIAKSSDKFSSDSFQENLRTFIDKVLRADAL